MSGSGGDDLAARLRRWMALSVDAIRARRLGGVRPAVRALALLAAGLTVVAMVVLAAAVVAGSPMSERSPAAQLVSDTLLFAGMTVGIAVLAATARTPSLDSPTAVLRVARAERAGTAAAAVAPLVLVLLLDLPAGATSPGAAPALRAVLWLGFGVGALLLLRSPVPLTHPVGPVDVGRAGRVAFTGAVLLVVVGLSLGGEPRPAQAVVQAMAPVVLGAFAALVIVPTALVHGSVAGLTESRARGETVLRRTREVPRFVVVVVVAKLGAVVAVGLLARWLRPDAYLVANSLPVWIGALVAAALMLGLLVLDRRLIVGASDHAVVARVAGALVAVPLGALVGVILGAIAVALAWQRPWVLPGLVGLPVLAWCLRHSTGRVRVLAYVAGALTAIGWSFVVGWAGTRIGAAVDLTQPVMNLATIAALLGAVVVVVLMGVVVVALVTRRRRMLVHLGAVALWVGCLSVLPLVGGTPTTVNLDVALGVLLLGASVVWAVRGRSAIDGYEIVVAAVLTTALLEIPVVLRLLPDGLQGWLLVLTLSAPAIATLWTALATVSDPGHTRTALRSVGMTCLAYSTLAALVWVLGSQGGDLVDALSSVVFGFLAVPLGMVLVAARSARTVGTAPTEGAPAAVSR